MVNHKITRFFHPVGQGAFYSERHLVNEAQFNIVYDCGSSSASNYIDKVIKTSFNRDDCIDILFISHFDADHVNKISLLLKNVRHIKKVVYPLLTFNEKELLKVFYSDKNSDEWHLIDNPDLFFNKHLNSKNDKTMVIGVMAHDYQEKNNDENILTSGAHIGIDIDKKINWVFIPYNYHSTSRVEKLKQILMEDLNVTEEKIIVTLNLYLSQNKTREIKKIYNQLEDTINNNSMLVYSGPNNECSNYSSYSNNHTPPLELLRNFSHQSYLKYCCTYHDYFSNLAGCIYTGDIDFNHFKKEESLETIYQKHYKNVIIIQVPHHGSRKSFNINFMLGKNNTKKYLCPISVGNNNIYGHPGGCVLNDIIMQGSVPILITENIGSLFYQFIRL